METVAHLISLFEVGLFFVWGYSSRRLELSDVSFGGCHLVVDIVCFYFMHSSSLLL